MYHSFDIKVAKELGVDQAIMISNFQYWIAYNSANKQNFHDGRYWTYNSYKSFTEIFPYFSPKQIRRIVQDLITKEVLIVGNFNELRNDHTNWYAFKDQAFWMSNLPPAQMGKQPKRASQQPAQQGNPAGPNGMPEPAQMGKALPDNKPLTDCKPHNSVAGATPENSPADQPGTPTPSQKKKSCAKKEKEPTEHWQALVDVWFKFYMDKKTEEPTFGGPEGKQLKEIVERLRKRAEKRRETKPELGPWDEQNACNTLLHFLQHAYKIDWINNNFLLSNLHKQFDKIIADAATGKTASNGGVNNNIKGQQPISAHSAFSKLAAINNGPGGSNG